MFRRNGRSGLPYGFRKLLEGPILPSGEPMAIEKRRLKPGGRAALAAGVGVFALLAAAFPFREDLLAWFIGYRFIWAPEGAEPRWGNSLNAAGQLLVMGSDAESDGIWSIVSGGIVRLDSPPGSNAIAHGAAINGKGHIVGEVVPLVSDGDGGARPFWWSPEGGMQ